MTLSLPPHQQQQFEFLLHTAVERLSEKLAYRFSGTNAALLELTRDSAASHREINDFVEAVFRDFLLDNTAGAVFLLQAMDDRPAIPPDGERTTLSLQLVAMARTAFTELLRLKTEEALEQQSVFAGGSMG
jgi:hypothetical protein